MLKMECFFLSKLEEDLLILEEVLKQAHFYKETRDDINCFIQDSVFAKTYGKPVKVNSTAFKKNFFKKHIFWAFYDFLVEKFQFQDENLENISNENKVSLPTQQINPVILDEIEKIKGIGGTAFRLKYVESKTNEEIKKLMGNNCPKNLDESIRHAKNSTKNKILQKVLPKIITFLEGNVEEDDHILQTAKALKEDPTQYDERNLEKYVCLTEEERNILHKMILAELRQHSLSGIYPKDSNMINKNNEIADVIFDQLENIIDQDMNEIIKKKPVTKLKNTEKELYAQNIPSIAAKMEELSNLNFTLNPQRAETLRRVVIHTKNHLSKDEKLASLQKILTVLRSPAEAGDEDAKEVFIKAANILAVINRKDSNFSKAELLYNECQKFDPWEPTIALNKSFLFAYRNAVGDSTKAFEELSGFLELLKHKGNHRLSIELLEGFEEDKDVFFNIFSQEQKEKIKKLTKSVVPKNSKEYGYFLDILERATFLVILLAFAFQTFLFATISNETKAKNIKFLAEERIHNGLKVPSKAKNIKFLAEERIHNGLKVPSKAKNIKFLAEERIHNGFII